MAFLEVKEIVWSISFEMKRIWKKLKKLPREANYSHTKITYQGLFRSWALTPTSKTLFSFFAVGAWGESAAGGGWRGGGDAARRCSAAFGVDMGMPLGPGLQDQEKFFKSFFFLFFSRRVPEDWWLMPHGTGTGRNPGTVFDEKSRYQWPYDDDGYLPYYFWENLAGSHR